MSVDNFFRVINDVYETEDYSIKKKNYAAKENVVDGTGNPEKVLFIKGHGEAIYIPENSQIYFFEEETLVYEVVLKKTFLKSQQAINLASPFSLVGDACFYNFMVRKIKIDLSLNLYNNKNTDILWMISGDLELKKDGGKMEFLPETPFIMEKTSSEYEICGKGEMFLLKL